MDLNWDYNHPADERIMQAEEDLPPWVHLKHMKA